MAEAHHDNRRLARRLVGVACVFLVFGAFAAPASAGIKQRLDDAKARLSQLRHEIDSQQKALDQLSAQAAALTAKLLDAQGRLELITEQLMQTRGELSDVRDHYEEVRAQLNDRLRQTYMNGRASSLEFLLGASTFADLSDRMEYVDALAATDNDLATEVENLRNELASQARAQERLQQKQTELVNGLQRDKAALDAKLSQQKQIYDDIQNKKAEAVKLVAKLGKQYRHYLSSFASVPINSKGVFRVCPVDQPRAFSDSFGAPRYAGGYHPHAGNDIIAPLGTPIRAPFDGTAYTSFNTLGGNAVYVRGALGYVYNAHLDHYSDLSNGPVHAGDIVGYVGWTGDAMGGVYHDHFEWHPYNTPSAESWPKSVYGYSVIDTGSGNPAVNPYPLLTPVC
jgi:peptidoglycan hydrolase CwlO-like protein